MLQHESDQWKLFLELWQEEKYFECHEVLELLWVVSAGDAKWRYQGLIHCAVALHQHHRENWFGMARQWLRAGAKLSRLPQEQLDADCLRIWSQTCRIVEAAAGKLSQQECSKLRHLHQQLQKRHPAKNKIMPLQDVFL